MESPSNGVTDFVIVLRNPEKPKYSQTIGTVGCWDGRELSYVLDYSFWGNGYMTEAVTMLLSYLWSSTDTKEILANVDPRNKPSLKMMERFGFQERDVEKNSCKTHLGWCDSIEFRLERPQVPFENPRFRRRQKSNQLHGDFLPSTEPSDLPLRQFSTS
jgi:RimJ/RimL family protein N-acetyltransferase